MRNMAFSLTTPQFCDRTKTVTRRIGWWFLKPGDVVMGIEKGMGLKKGESVNRLGVIRILSIHREQLNEITVEDVTREGFPEFSVDEFIEMFCKGHAHCKPGTDVNRIEYEYVDA